MKKFLFVILFLLIFNGKIFAHGTGYKISNLKAVPLEFFYSTGEKMSYREVKVFSPKDQKFPIQSGRTDEYGRFAFIPDCSGDWRVIARDEEGHQCEAKINIDFSALASPLEGKRATSGEGVNLSVNKLTSPLKMGDENGKIFNALLGVSLIFNIAAFVKLRSCKNAH